MMLVASWCAAGLAGEREGLGHALNALGRWSGYGWSRGYHSRDGAPLTNSPLPDEGPYFPRAAEIIPAGPPLDLQSPLPAEAPQPRVLLPRTPVPRIDESRRLLPNSPYRAQRYPLDHYSR